MADERETEIADLRKLIDESDTDISAGCVHRYSSGEETNAAEHKH